jgi:hypothetical protein
MRSYSPFGRVRRHRWIEGQDSDQAVLLCKLTDAECFVGEVQGT